MPRERIGKVQRPDVDAHGGGGQGEWRGGEFRLRPHLARAGGLRRAEGQRGEVREAQAVKRHLAGDGRRRSGGGAVDRLLGTLKIGARDRFARRRRRLVGKRSACLDAGDRGGDARGGPALAAQGDIGRRLDRPDCAARSRYAEEGGERRDVVARDPERAEQARLVALRLRRKTAAAGQRGAGERSGRVDVETGVPRARAVQLHVPRRLLSRRRLSSFRLSRLL